MANLECLFLHFLVCFLWFQLQVKSSSSIAETKALVHVGVVLNLNSPESAIAAEAFISKAISDFYVTHPDYTTRLFLHTEHSSDGGVAAAFAVVELLRNAEMRAIIVPQASANDVEFLMTVGENAAVPIISFSEAGPCLRPSKKKSHDLTETAPAGDADPSQVKAIAATLNKFGYCEVALVYEDSEYGKGIIPHLTDALQVSGIRAMYRSKIPTSAVDSQILRELNVLANTKAKAFLVKMSPALGSRFFALARKTGIMGKGNTWLITDGYMLPNSTAIDSNEVTVIGLRPRAVPLMNPIDKVASEPNISAGLWVYDTIWALAMAVERDLNSYNLGARRKLLEDILLNIQFRGLSGDFRFANRQMRPSTHFEFEILNLTGDGGRKIGLWTWDQGIISTDLGETRKIAYSTAAKKLKKPITPGDSWTRGRRLATSTSAQTLSIGIPVKTGFTEFVNANPKQGKEPTGFSIDVFKAVWDHCCQQIPYQFEAFHGSYDDLCCQVPKQKFDAVVGDITIVASRTNCVDYTLPYLNSAVTMLIKVGYDRRKDMWIFLKPLSWDLWLTIILSCIFMGLVIRFLERHANEEFKGPTRRQLTSTLMFPCVSAVLPQRELVVTNCSRFVLVVWLFLAFILMQSYTANLSSILTVDQLNSAVPSLKELKQQPVGYQSDSHVRSFLINELGFNGSMLRPYSSVREYHKALSLGPKRRGVAAIFDDIPCIKVFLKKYGSTYKMIGPTYRTDGLGFGFPIGSHLVANVSRSILNITQSKKMNSLQKKYFDTLNMDEYDDETGSVSPSSPSLTTRSFGGLFVITWVLSLLAVIGSESHIWERLMQKYFCANYPPSEVADESRVVPTDEMATTHHSHEIDPENHVTCRI